MRILLYLLLLLGTLFIKNISAQFDRSECGVSKGCHIPEASACPQGCRGMGVSWRLLDDHTLLLELFVNSNSSTGRYVAVGFSDDQNMGNEPVIECSSIGDEPASMKFSFDRPNGKSNMRINGDYSNHFSESVTSFKDGLFYCKSKVNVGGNSNEPQVFHHDPSQQYHLLLVNGMTKSTGLTHHSPKQDAVSPKIRLMDINFGFDSGTCGKTKQCTIPYQKDCYGFDTNVTGMAASYKKIGENQIEFEITGPANLTVSDHVYVALGFSPDGKMSNISVIECSKMGGEDKPSMKFSYNPGFTNARITGEPDIRAKLIQQKSSYIQDGTIYCNAVVNVGGDPSNNQTFKWRPTEKYFMLMAKGMVSDDGNLVHHTGDCSPPSSTYLDPQELLFDDNGCGSTKACFMPTDCADNYCNGIKASWRVTDDNKLAVELTADQTALNNYVALGFSTNGKMGNASVIECSSFNNQSYSMTYSYNYVTEHFYNWRPTSDVKPLISDETVKLEDGQLYCSATFEVKGDPNDPAIFKYDPTQEYHLIMAAGPTRSNQTYQSLSYHSNKRSLSPPQLLTDMNPTTVAPATAPTGTGTFDPSTCGKTKGCYQPDSDSSVSYRVISDDSIEFEIFSTQASANGVYTALGFSNSGQMSPANVIECSSLQGQPLSMKFSYNQGTSNERISGEEAIRAQYITDTQVSYQDGKAYCKGTVRVNGNANSQIFKYSPDTKYYLLLAKGPASASGLGYHPTRPKVSSQRQLSDLGAGNGSGSTATLVILHAIFMTVAWLILVPIAVIFARVLRSSWPTTKPGGLLIWFHIHRTANLLGIALMIAGFVLILVKKDWKFTTVGWGGKHALIGIVALCLAWLQPFISTLRCSPNDPRRPFFNYIHRGIGISAMILATTAICIAGYHFTPSRNVAQLVLALIPISLLIGISIFFVAFNSIVTSDNSNFAKKNQSNSQNIPMRPAAKNGTTTTWSVGSSQTDSSPVSDDEKDEKKIALINRFREFVVYGVVLVFIAIGTILCVFFGLGLSS